MRDCHDLPNISIVVARVIIDPVTVVPVSPPRDVSAVRTAASEAKVMFDPQSLGVFQVNYYVANDPSSQDLVCV